MSAHRYWRLYITANWTGAYAAVSSVEMREEAGSSNLSVTGNGTATASTIFDGTFTADKAFDSSGVSSWASQNAAALPQWVKWNFGAGNEQDINHLTLVNHYGTSTTNIRTAKLQYSDDDSSWTDHINIVENPQTASASSYYVSASTSEIDAALPMPTCVAYLDRYGDPEMGMPAVEFEFGQLLEVALPMPAIEIRLSGFTLDVAMPMPAVSASIVERALNTIAAPLPMPEVEFVGGASVATAMPMPTVEFEGTTTLLVHIDAVMPMATVEAAITKTEDVSIAATLPMPTVQAFVGAQVDAAMPMPVVYVESTTGGVLSITAVMPMPQVDAGISAEGTVSIEVEMPMLVSGPWGTIVAVMPMALVEVVARSVVTVTYEAYSINLAPVGKQKVRPVTRYTNRPFSGMVRWQGNWYGWGPDGLYLIGGDDDDGAAIPWSWHTAVTNFGSRQMKVVRETFIHGRLGATVSASVSIGEAADVTYAAVIERGRTAQAHRIKYGRGLKAEYWSFGLADVTGSAMEVDSMQHEPQPLSRKI